MYDDDANLPDFERRLGIGKVLRPQILAGAHVSEDTAFEQRGLYQEPHTTETLQELWDEAPAEAQGLQDGAHMSGMGRGAEKEHADRLEHMRTRTGMTFASSLREFDEHTGLAKYGADLSDDDEQAMEGGAMYTVVPGNRGNGNGRLEGSGTGQMASVLRYSSARPSLQTVAYDSELDASD